ncbi:MAG: hypothetical protein IIW40_00295, partial [Clostridia bacterium]|nr:hypothetical protein [Clostridia bacterium]
RGASFALHTEKTLSELELDLAALGSYTYYASIVDIPESNRNVDLMARSYLIYKKGDQTIYLYDDATFEGDGSMACVRNLQEVIDAANS